MQNLTYNQRMFVKAIADAAQGVKTHPQKVTPRPVQNFITPQQQAAFEAYRFTCYTQYGQLTGTFRETRPSAVTGEPVAYYDVQSFDTEKRCTMVKTFLYGIRGGVVTCIKQFDWREAR